MKIIASDYDGTLFINDEVSQNTINKIREFKSLGHKFVIVTGRHIGAIYDEAIHRGIDFDYVIGNNGGIIVDKDKNIVFAQYIDKDVAVDILEMKNNPGVQFLLATDGFSNHTHFQNQAVKDYFKGHFMNVDIINEEELLNNGLLSVFFKMEDDNLSIPLQKSYIEKHQGLLDGFQNANIVDLVANGVSKAHGIAKLNEILKADEIYVVGDDYNDISMFEKYHGYAINTGIEELKKLAIASVNGVDEVIDLILKP